MPTSVDTGVCLGISRGEACLIGVLCLSDVTNSSYLPAHSIYLVFMLGFVYKHLDRLPDDVHVSVPRGPTGRKTATSTVPFCAGKATRFSAYLVYNMSASHHSLESDAGARALASLARSITRYMTSSSTFIADVLAQRRQTTTICFVLCAYKLLLSMSSVLRMRIAHIVLVTPR